MAASLFEDDLESDASESLKSVDPSRLCREVLDYGPRKGEECGGTILDVPSESDYLGRISSERVCQSCGAFYGSGILTEKPYNRKPMSNIAFDRNAGTSHLKLFDEMLKRGMIKSLVGRKDPKTFYRMRHLYGSVSLEQRVLNQGLELLSDSLERAGKLNDHRFGDLAGKEFRKLLRKRLPKNVAFQIELAQQYISKNRPSAKEIDGMVADAIRRVDPRIIERLRVRQNHSR